MDTIIERREVPDWVADRITRKGGSNIFGGPNFRVVWGGNRMHIVGGKFKKVVNFQDEDGRERAFVMDVVEERELPKYHTGRWHLEKWMDPSYYGSREQWEWSTLYVDPDAEQTGRPDDNPIHTMGPYPDRGEYEHVFFLGMCPHIAQHDGEWCWPCRVGMGQYIDLEPHVYLLEMQIEALQKSKDVTAMMEKTALFDREDRKRTLRNAIVADRVENAMRPKLATQPTSWQSGTGGPCSVPEPKSWQRSSAPIFSRKQLGFRQSNHFAPALKQEQLDKEKEN